MRRRLARLLRRGVGHFRTLHRRGLPKPPNSNAWACSRQTHSETEPGEAIAGPDRSRRHCDNGPGGIIHAGVRPTRVVAHLMLPHPGKRRRLKQAFHRNCLRANCSHAFLRTVTTVMSWLWPQDWAAWAIWWADFPLISYVRCKQNSSPCALARGPPHQSIRCLGLAWLDAMRRIDKAVDLM